MGHIAHLRNQFKSINTFENSYDYIIDIDNIDLIGMERTHYLLFENEMVKDCVRMLCAKSGWNLLSDSGEEDFLIVNVFLLFGSYPPLENGVALHLNKLESFSPKDALCKVWLFLDKKIFRLSQYIFCYLVIISPWKRAWPFIWIFNPFHPRMLFAKFEIGPVVLEKKMKIWKDYRRTKGDQKRSLELSAQAS